MAEPLQPTYIIPDELAAGVPATNVGVWHSQDEFVLDFFAQVAPFGQRDADGQLVLPMRLVSRVRVPRTVIFSIASAIAQNVSNYEDTFGPITPRPADRE